MHDEVVGHETPSSVPVGAEGFGVGTIDHPDSEASAGVARAKAISVADTAAAHLLMATPLGASAATLA